MRKVIRRVLALAAGGGIALAPPLTSGAAASAATTYYASPAGGGTGTSCASALTLNGALAAASAGDTVIACPGTYRQSVSVARATTLHGMRGAIIDAVGNYEGITVNVAGAVVSGLVVENAEFTGIYVTKPRVTIFRNTVKRTVPPGYAYEAGILLLDADRSRVISNTVVRNIADGITIDESPGALVRGNEISGNAFTGVLVLGTSVSRVLDNNVTANGYLGLSGGTGAGAGVYLSDSASFPSARNVIEGNRIDGNAFGPGILLNASPRTFPGVFGNLVRGNSIVRNGTHPIAPGEGSGSGVEIANATYTSGTDHPSWAVVRRGDPEAGGNVYGNEVIGNSIRLNGKSGVSVYKFAAGNMNGNVVSFNHIGKNNVVGDTIGLPKPYSRLSDPRTTGILVASASRLSVCLGHNVIGPDHYGIWMNTNVHAPGSLSNRFFHVDVPIFVAH